MRQGWLGRRCVPARRPLCCGGDNSGLHAPNYQRLVFGTSGLRLDNPRDGVNQLLVWGWRRGETAPGKRRRGAGLDVQAGIGSKRRDGEVPKTRPVAVLGTERGVNERAGIVAGKRFGSPRGTVFIEVFGEFSEKGFPLVPRSPIRGSDSRSANWRARGWRMPRGT